MGHTTSPGKYRVTDGTFLNALEHLVDVLLPQQHLSAIKRQSSVTASEMLDMSSHLLQPVLLS
jgi:hypothetical protein